jgi:hypothetical protein
MGESKITLNGREKMPQNIESWKRLYGLAEQAMLRDKDEISQLKQKLNKAEQLPKAQWVSVDTPPETNLKVVGYSCCEANPVDLWSFVDTGKGGNQWFRFDDCYCDPEVSQYGWDNCSEPTHWMPLPEPPK